VKLVQIWNNGPIKPNRWKHTKNEQLSTEQLSNGYTKASGMEETHFAYEDGDSDYGHMDVTHLDIIIFFVKPNGSIDHLIGYESVKKIAYWYLCLYEEWMLTLTPTMRICILLIVQQLKQFSKVINFLLFGNARHQCYIIYSTTNIFEGSKKAIILLPRSWIETY